MDNWTPHAEVNQILRVLLDEVRALLDNRFVGMYLYGSLAAGDFQPDRSDVDFVVVTDDLLSETVVSRLASMHVALATRESNWAHKLEGAYVPVAVLRRHDATHPAVPILNEGRFYCESLSSDWTIRRHQLHTHDVPIAGPPVTDLVDPVSIDELRWAVRDTLKKWWAPMVVDPTWLRAPGYQPYAVLSMCRSLYTLEESKPISKTDAAQWALTAVPPDWSPLIRSAMVWRTGDETDSVERTVEFICYTIDRVSNGD
jgi:predicted nucleotidyltransferase